MSWANVFGAMLAIGGTLAFGNGWLADLTPKSRVGWCAVFAFFCLVVSMLITGKYE